MRVPSFTRLEMMVRGSLKVFRDNRGCCKILFARRLHEADSDTLCEALIVQPLCYNGPRLFMHMIA